MLVVFKEIILELLELRRYYGLYEFTKFLLSYLSLCRIWVYFSLDFAMLIAESAIDKWLCQLFIIIIITITNIFYGLSKIKLSKSSICH